jgi:hypothetical protein
MAYLGTSMILLVALAAGGALVLFLTLRRGTGWRKKMRGYFFGSLIAGFLLIGLGVGLAYVSSAPSTIVVGTGYLSIRSPGGFGAGDLNITRGDVSQAYLAQIGSGNLSLSKQYGTNTGDLNIGVFTLGNGATARVVSDNSTDLVIRLNSGEYLILGTPNTGLLAAAFSQYVYPVGETAPQRA